MIAQVKQVIGSWQGADGRVAEVVYSGSSLSVLSRFSSVDKLTRPAIEVSVAMLLDDGVKVILPFKETAKVLPDKSGVAVVFSESRRLADGPSYVAPPHNAAIYNSDGSLRFILQNPHGVGTMFWGFQNSTDDELRISVREMDGERPTGDCVMSYLVDSKVSNLSWQLPVMIRL